MVDREVAFYALVDPRDANHVMARGIARRLQVEPWQLFTTNFIRAETHALILNRLGHQVADRFLRELGAGPRATLIRVTADDEAQALRLIAQYRDKDFSLVDATSFAVMERLGIATAFSFDRHFAQYGCAIVTDGIGSA